MRPLKYAPSSMLIRDVVMSPITWPSFLISTRSRAWRFPDTLPYTMTSRAVISVFSCALRPTVSRWPRREIGPSTLPSISRSSSLEISPLIVMVEPRHARVRAVGGAIGRMPALAFAGAAGIFESLDIVDPGTSAVVSLFHIIPPNFHAKLDSVRRDLYAQLYVEGRIVATVNWPGNAYIET